VTDDCTRWLDDEEQRAWRSFLRAAAAIDEALDRQLQRDAGMPHIYYGLLVQLAQAPRRQMRMTQLAKDVKITRSRLSHAVARLERNGWVRREDCPSDKRGQNAVLTDEGYEMLRRSAPGHVRAVRQAMFDRLTPEQVRSFGEIMQIIATGLEPDGADADLPWLR
jgi:DNA-binding MarR family transcriptional regulator